MADLTEGSYDPVEDALERISVIIDGVVAQQCARHYTSLTQEHQLTSRIAQAIESELEHHSFEGVHLDVKTQEFPDRGRYSLEKPTGADLYISLVRSDGKSPVSKGMLVQSKWDSTISHRSERRRLIKQMHDMLDRSNDSYVFLYGPTGATVVPAREMLSGRAVIRPTSTVGDVIASGLRCNAGDRHIGRDLRLPISASLNSILERLAANTVLDLALRNEE